MIIESGVIKPLIKISELNSDVDIENNSRGIIFPYEIEENKFRPFTEEKFQDIYPQTYLALKLWQNELKLRSSFKKGGVWYEWGRTQSMKSIKDKLLTKTFNNFPQFMLDTTDSLFSNGYALKPKGVSLSFIQKILNSQFFWKYAKLTSFEIEGGYQCYQKNFIENFTIPESLIALEEEVINMKYLSSTFFINIMNCYNEECFEDSIQLSMKKNHQVELIQICYKFQLDSRGSSIDCYF